MQIDHLVAFERVVREGSISQAARALGLPQPTLSDRIHALEREVGGPLLARGGRGVTLTELGVSFFPHARRAVADVAEGLEAVRLARGGQRGRVSVVAFESLVDTILASVVPRFHAQHPEVELHIRTGHTEQVLNLLQEGTYRLGLLAWPCMTVHATVCVRLREPLVLVVGPAHPLAGRPPIPVSTVAALARPLLLVRWSIAFDAWLETVVGVTRSTVEVPDAIARQLLLHGHGAAFFLRTIVADDLATGRLVEVPLADGPPLFRESALVYLPSCGDPLSAAATKFVEVVRQEATSLGLAQPPA